MTDAPDLKPCQSCSSKIGPFVASPDGKRQVICSTCGARGPYENKVTTAEDGWNRPPTPTLADALALPAVQVGVKPLEWVDFADLGAKAMAWNDANYMIQKWSDGRWEISASYPGYSTSLYGIDRFHSTLEAAKAAAQADYEARILSALEPAPEVAALVEAAHGLSFGEDWNNGTAAKAHRNALLTAIAGIKGKNASPQAFAALSRIAPTNEVTPNDHNLQIRRASGRASDDPR